MQIFNIDKNKPPQQTRQSMTMKLRPYQETAKAEIYKAWSNHKNVLLSLPTGGGKTKLFCSIAIDLAIHGITGQKLPTAIMVHRKELLSQICVTLAEEGIPHNIIAPRNVILGIVAAQRTLLKKQFYDYNASITVISVDTLNARILKHEKWAKSIKFWITDEAAHLLKENKWGRAVKYFPNAIGLGVTATPERLDKRGLGSHVDGVFDFLVEGPGTRWLIENGFLCKYKIAIPDSDYQNYLNEPKAIGADYSNVALAFASEKSHIIGDVIENYKKHADGKQAIVFNSDINSAIKMEKKFKDAGIIAKLLTGFSEDSVRLKSLIDYRDKKIQVLLNVDLFDEGLDVPGIECVIMARKTKSLSKYLQMCGRGLRVAKGKPYLILIDHVGNVNAHGLPDSKRKWSLDRVSKRKKNLNLIRICANIKCNAPFDRILNACPYCGLKLTAPKSLGGARPSPLQVDGDLVLLDPETLRELEKNATLEAPASVAERVAKVAGGPAGIRAMHNQIERIETQKQLAETVAKWAGRLRAEGMTDRQIHKYFFVHHQTTISEILAKPKAEMSEWILTLGGELGEIGIGNTAVDSA